MSKNNKTEETTIANPKGKTVEELKEIVQTLQTQLQEYRKQTNRYQTMAAKAQGAIEVILQLIPKEEVEEMIAQEAQENRDNGEVVEG